MNTYGATPVYELINLNRCGRLLLSHEIDTPIKGYEVHFRNDRFECRLYKSGRLFVRALSEWDFGTMAPDTPAMIIASLPHDAFCLMTDAGLLPWKVRRQADNFFTSFLFEHCPKGGRFKWRTGLSGLFAGVAWVFVSVNSQFFARWRAQPYVQPV